LVLLGRGGLDHRTQIGERPSIAGDAQRLGKVIKAQGIEAE
jgi:hypothetical protein